MAMKHFIIILTLVPIFTFCGQGNKNTGENNNIKNQRTLDSIASSSQTTYYFIRHAEKVRTDPKDQDPHLNAAGKNRAKNWAVYFENIPLDEIFETQYKRTHQTISYIAKRKDIIPKVYDADSIYSEEFLKETNGKTILIVGHSNTIPYLVNKLIEKEKFTEMEDSDNATLFKVTIDSKGRKAETIFVN